ncbi:CHAT domain-containing protein [Vararia minispora EC-137]|uniref:CHAT domain-containing protein n=1 Tax=Vararia minispora EC-137 TaxID=1314806 RepID=A0ACB8Q9I2_9AGAM|nr:CHAT domain-containing protein [Vararia minispora EC-137]
MLGDRIKELKKPEDPGQALVAERQAVDRLPENHPDMPLRLNKLGNSFFTRFKQLGELSDLEEALAADLREVELTPDNHPDKPTALSNLGVSLYWRFERLGELPDLEQALTATHQAVKLTPDDHPDKSRRLSNLGASLRSRFERLGELPDLEQALVAIHQAVELTADNHPDKPTRLSNLSFSLRLRFERMGELPDLDRALVSIHQAVALTPDSHPDKPTRLRDLGASLRSRFERLGDLRDLEQALAADLRAVEITPDNHPDKPRGFGNLAGQKAVELTPDNHPDKPTTLSNLSVSLYSRFKQLGELSDLEQTLATIHKAVLLTPDNHPDKPKRLNNLCTSLRSRFELLGEFPNLEGALAAGQRALELIPDSHPDKPMILSSLGASLHSRFEQLGEFPDLERALEIDRQAVELTPDNHADKPTRLSNLSISLYSRFERLSEYSDLERARATSRRAVELIPTGHADRAYHLLVHGVHLRGQSPDQLRFNSAFSCFMEAVNVAAGPPAVKLRAALENSRMWTELPQFDPCHAMTLRAHTSVLDSIPPFIWLGQRISHRFSQLSRMQIGSAITAAASSAISAGDLALALEWLEEGRNVVWGQLIRLRHPLGDLEAYDPVSRAAFTRSLSAGGTTSITIGHPVFDVSSSHMALEDEAQRHRELATAYEDLVAQIRRIEGFGNFLRPKSHSELALACQDGPVVVINVDRARCDALVLCRSAKIVFIPLPNLSLRIVVSMRSKLIAYLAGRFRSSYDERAARIANQNLDNSLKRILTALWQLVVAPILDALREELAACSVGNRLPHITWCPTSLLSSLPLHAAGTYDNTNSCAHKVSDVVVSSYIPSLSALLTARAHPVQHIPGGDPRILVVSQSETPGQTSLPHAREEAPSIRKYFPNTVTHLDDTNATVDTVFSAMTEHDWTHLACHGAQDPRSPTGSAFFLHDGRLELSRLMGMSHARAELAVLSACQTAKGSDDLPEEAVRLAAGMLAAGYKSVVATMWSIADEDGSVLSDALYVALKRNLDAGEGLNAAYALHDATEKLREAVGEINFLRWVPFVHFGV